TGANAAAVSRKKTPRPMARPVGGSQSQRPSHETARNRPMTVASDASAGHNRSQKIVQRARRNARASNSSPARPCGGSWGGARAGGGGVGGPMGQVHLLQRESTQFAILTCN